MRPNLILNLILATLFNAMVGAVLALLIGINPVWGVAINVMLGAIPRTRHAFMAGLNHEIWLTEILEKFYPDWSFLTESRDMSSMVEHNTINLADAGADPAVLIDNNTYPVDFAQRTDSPIALPLHTLDTEGTLVRNAEEIETAYDKMNSVVMGHRNALANQASRMAAHAWAPAEDGTDTPVIRSTGDADNGFKRLTLDDLIKARAAFDKEDVPYGDRILVLHPDHYAHLIAEDKDLFKNFIGQKPGFELFGFKTYGYSKTPIFNKTTGEKVALGAAAAPSTDTISSIFYQKSEVMRAMGTVEMFSRLRDPEQKGDIINFQMRFTALPLRGKAIGAVISAAA